MVGNILLNTSITATKSKRDKGPLCLWPRELLKKLDHLYHFSSKPHLLNRYNKKPQLTWSYAFSRFNLQITPGSHDLILLSGHSFAIRTKSRICLSRIKAFWDLEITFSNTASRLIGRKFLISTALALLGIRGIQVALRLLSNFPLAWNSRKASVISSLKGSPNKIEKKYHQA